MIEQRAELTAEAAPGQVSVYRAGSSTPVLVQRLPADRRPFIHPIVVPGGTAAVTEDEPAHHPWQHGLSVGLNDVNGVGFWTEGRRPESAHRDGTFHPRSLGRPWASGNRAMWALRTEYRHPKGSTLLHETQEWTLTDHGDRFDLDLILTFQADLALTFGQYPYGGLFLRMPYRPEIGGVAFNNAAEVGAEADARRATWVAVRMPVPGHHGEVCVAVFDHPSNPEHPVPWRVDHQLGVAPSAGVARAWELDPGERRRFWHRVVVFASSAKPGAIDALWTGFSKQDLLSRQEAA